GGGAGCGGVIGGGVAGCGVDEGGVAARGGEWVGVSYRSGDGECFWGSPEKFSGGGGVAGGWPEVAGGNLCGTRGVHGRAYAIDGGIWYSVVSSKMNQLHSFKRGLKILLS
nr:hypothetical protein [Tanacetum cinerariifolium]